MCSLKNQPTKQQKQQKKTQDIKIRNNLNYKETGWHYFWKHYKCSKNIIEASVQKSDFKISMELFP